LGLSGDNALPCLYYEMDLKSPSMNVSGFSLPGFPSILFGINASMAWGGGRDERMQSIQIGEINTSRAAVRSGSLSVILAMDSAGNDKLMFRWTDFRDPGEFFFHINRCVSRKEACGLLKRLSAPVMRWICADTAGVTSCVNGSNSPGASEKDYDVKPAFYLSDWLQLRFEMLISEDSVSVMNCQSIQTENYSVFAGRILPIMLEMLSGSPDSTCQFWMGKFKVWDMNMRIGDAEAALFETWMQKVGYHLWYEDLGPLLFRSLMASPSVWQPALVHTFENAEKNPGSEEFIPPDKLCRLSETSLLETLQEVEEQQGKFNSSWSWGKVHAITYRHIISRHSSFKISQSMGLTQPFVLGPYALDGSASTLSGMVSSSKPFEMSGSMARMIVDLDRLDNTLSIISTGQSGQILDLHYQDQIPLFSRNYYHPNLFNRERIRNAGWLKLIVNPKSAP
jgi:acyl-homoserine lactone acylase PvdQ